MNKILLILILCTVGYVLLADNSDQALAIKQVMDTPFSAAKLEAERDAALTQLSNPVKGEFETSSQFDERKKEYTLQTSNIRADYTKRIAEAKAAHEAYIQKLTLRFDQLLAQSLETKTIPATIGKYDADKQQYTISIPDKAFQIVVPLEKAPSVKSNFSSYTLKVTRKLNRDLAWEYLEATLEGAGNSFSSTDRVPANVIASTNPKAFFPPDLVAELSFTEPSGDGILEAEETATISISIKNIGKGAASMVEAKLQNVSKLTGLNFPPSVYFGTLQPSESQSRQVDIVAGRALPDAEVEILLDFTEQNGFPPDSKRIKFSTKALLPPQLYIAEVGIDDNSGNGKIEPGEQVKLIIRIQNRGQGMARGLRAELHLGQGIFLMQGSEASIAIGNLQPGTYQDLDYSIVTAKTATALDLKLSLTESRSEFSQANLPINLSFNKMERTAEAMVIAAKNTSANPQSSASLLIDIEQDIPHKALPDKNRWGVIIGIEHYRNVSNVRFALRDAEFMKEYFLKVLGIPAENIYMKTDDAATLSEMKTVFDPKGWLASNASDPNSEIFIYYSGHGAPDPNGKKAYLLPSDGNPNYASISGYDLDQLYKNLQSLKAKQINIFLDSCFSGANRDNEIILADARPVFISTAMPNAVANLAVFSASGGSQISSAFGDKQHGLFSYFLMKGFRGDADANSDRKITQKELQDYLLAQVGSTARRLGREQNPELQSSDKSKVLVSW